jgi:serine/threonine-protein kinase
MKTQESMLARYSILHELGQGATGRVYAARDRETGAVVALKRIDPALLGKSDPSFTERFLKQARSARALKHRNIVTVHEAGEAAGTVYVAMELLEGESLRKFLAAGSLPITRAIRIAHDIASGLAHAHLEGVVHGALKPSNVIVLRSGLAKITDFGIGLVAHAAQAGGASYLAPEQIRGDAVDHRCDIFSFGALFYEMLTHRPPAAEPLPPSELNPHVPRALDGTVLSMLARQPASRMAGIPVLLPELQRLEEGLGLGLAVSANTTEPTASVPPPEPKPEPRPQTPGIKRLREREPMQDVPRVNEPTDHEAFDYQNAIAVMDRESRRQRSSESRRTIWAPLILMLALSGIGAAGYVYYSSSGGEARIQSVLARVAASTPRIQEAPVSRRQEPPLAAATEPAREVGPQRVVDATPKPATPEPAPAPAPTPMPVAQAPKTEPPIVRASEKTESVPAAAVEKPARAIQPIAKATAKAPERQPGGTARVTLAISPRGDIFIDGKHHGATPPLTTFDLEPGMHRIEVRSGSRTPYLTYMMVQAGDVRSIRHNFDTTGAVHPPGARRGRVATVD